MNCSETTGQVTGTHETKRNGSVVMNLVTLANTKDFINTASSQFVSSLRVLLNSCFISCSSFFSGGRQKHTYSLQRLQVNEIVARYNV